jgi:hypothetical protein
MVPEKLKRLILALLEGLKKFAFAKGEIVKKFRRTIS